ncbi:MAG: pyridoxamine 5'-phosphate oxidase [Flammeovirgaceae bacterium]|jgi:pyridoxamine 5'-phosphate oxidase
MNLADIRDDYRMASLEESEVANNPILQFEKWMEDVLKAEVIEPNAMTISTVGAEGKPSARIVLLKGLENGFVFYTNYESQKGKELAENPYASLTFFWADLQRQVRVEGKVQKISEEASINYFHSRPKGSQIGAAVSPQSSVIPNREFLENRKNEIEKKYESESQIPKPENWGGYVLVPNRVEFWQGRSSRLHDRLIFEQEGNGNWKMERLAP